MSRGIDVMRLVTSAEPVVSVDKVVEELRTTRATAQRLLATLVEHRFLRPSRDPNRFFADVSSLTVGRAYFRSVDGLDSLSATLRTFQHVEKVGVTVWVRERIEGMCLVTSGMRESLVGRRFDLDLFAAGHALMWSAEGAARIALLERSARASSARSTARPGAVYGSFHQFETEGYCLFEATPGSSERAAAFPFRASPGTVAFAFSLERMAGEPALKPPRTGELVKQVTDLAMRAFAL